MLSAAPRLTLAKTGILKIPIAIIAFIALEPNSAVMRIAITRDGNAKIRSLVRMINSSKKDSRRVAAASPKGTPTRIPIPTAKKATANEVRAPT